MAAFHRTAPGRRQVAARSVSDRLIESANWCPAAECPVRYASKMSKKREPSDAGGASHGRALLLLMIYGILGGAVICAGAYFGVYEMHRMDK